MPTPSIATRKRTRSTNLTENHIDQSQSTSTNTLSTNTASVSLSSVPTNTTSVNGPPKRQRNNPPGIGAVPPPPPVAPRTSYSFRNRSLTPDPRHPSARFPSLNAPASRSNTRSRYNLRPRRPQSQIRLPQMPPAQPTVPPRHIRRPIPPIAQSTTSTSLFTTNNQALSSTVLTSPLSNPIAVLPNIPSVVTIPTPPAIQPRQYRLVYISDDDDENIPTTTTTTGQTTEFNIVTNDDLIRPRRSSRTTSGVDVSTRLRTTIAIPSSASSTSSSSSSSTSSSSLTTINAQDYMSGIAHVRLSRAIEIVIDSIQSLEGAVNSFDQLVFGLIYGRFNTQNEFDSIEGMIHLSRVLNLDITSRLSQAEIDALPKINFVNKIDPTASAQSIEKCPICLTEFNEQELINKLHCTHLFHLQCISTWLNVRFFEMLVLLIDVFFCFSIGK